MIKRTVLGIGAAIFLGGWFIAWDIFYNLRKEIYRCPGCSNTIDIPRWSWFPYCSGDCIEVDRYKGDETPGSILREYEDD